MAVARATKFQDDLNLLLERPFDIEQEISLLSELALPAEDGIPMESNWHRIEMNLLIDSVHALWRGRDDYFVGGNMFIYFSLDQVRRKDYRGPDFFVVKGVDSTADRESWVVWREDGRYPNVIVELASPSTIDTDLGVKKTLYAQTFQTAEYFCYDPAQQQLHGWFLQNHRHHYEELQPNEEGWLWSEELHVWLGIWIGEFQRRQAVWLRFYTPDKQLVLTMAEAEAQRAEAEAQRAEAEAQRAEAEAQRADREARRAVAAEDELARLKSLLQKHGIVDE